MRNKEKYNLKHSIFVNNTQEKVWNFLTDVERWKEWDTEITKSQLKGQFKVNANGSFKPKGGPILQFHISELRPNKSYAFIAKMPFCNFNVRRTIITQENSIEFIDEIKFTGILKKIYHFMLQKRITKVLPIVLKNFKQIAELE